MTISAIESQNAGMQSLEQIMRDKTGNRAEGALDKETADELQEMILKEFDADASGDLSSEEMQTMAEQFENSQAFQAIMTKIQELVGQNTQETDVGEGQDTDPVGTLMESLGDSLSTDEADADGNGVTTMEELADYLNMSVEDLRSELGTAPANQESQGQTQTRDMGQNLLRAALEAYQMGMEQDLAQTSLDTIG